MYTHVAMCLLQAWSSLSHHSLLYVYIRCACILQTRFSRQKFSITLAFRFMIHYSYIFTFVYIIFHLCVASVCFVYCMYMCTQWRPRLLTSQSRIHVSRLHTLRIGVVLLIHTAMPKIWYIKQWLFYAEC